MKSRRSGYDKFSAYCTVMTTILNMTGGLAFVVGFFGAIAVAVKPDDGSEFALIVQFGFVLSGLLILGLGAVISLLSSIAESVKA